jgi:sulfatase modifying factor 1
MLLALLAGFPGPAALPSADSRVQSGSIPGQLPRDLPAEASRILPYAEKLAKNTQGFWEATLLGGPEMVFIPAGEFLMGSRRQEAGREPLEGPVHRVFVSAIWMGKYEVTRELWHAVMGGAPVRAELRSLPVTDVSFDDVQQFLGAIRDKTGLGFRLPTEAEWEKCARGGSSAASFAPLDESAWHVGNSDGRAHPVGTRMPNGFGLYDMLGNVWEWCADWMGLRYYETSPILDPKGPAKGKRRVGRGGGYLHGGNYLRFAHRNDNLPSARKPYLGFRLALDPGVH